MISELTRADLLAVVELTNFLFVRLLSPSKKNRTKNANGCKREKVRDCIIIFHSNDMISSSHTFYPA